LILGITGIFAFVGLRDRTGGRTYGGTDLDPHGRLDTLKYSTRNATVELDGFSG
jgi:hypothetical protein